MRVAQCSNIAAYESCDLVPSVLAGVETIDMSTTVMGQRLAMPLFCSPTALQRLFHHDGERAVAKAAEKFGTMFGISSLGTISIEEIGSTICSNWVASARARARVMGSKWMERK